ncbi:hypothetical protein Dimus_028265 [Dionaea muscipula]
MGSRDPEIGGGSKTRFSSGNGNHSYMVEEEDAEENWTSWLIPIFVVLNVAVFVVMMSINNCPKHVFQTAGGFDAKCVARFLGRFSFEPLSENPLFGPSSATDWVYGGSLGKGKGSGGVLMVVVVNSVAVGASGALFGLLGAMLSELITNWSIYTNKMAALATLLVVVLINLTVGILPHVDNFSHIGGFLTGFFLGFVLLPRPHIGHLASQYPTANVGVRSKYKVYQIVLWVISLCLVIAGFTVGLAMLFHGENGGVSVSAHHLVKIYKMSNDRMISVVGMISLMLTLVCWGNLVLVVVATVDCTTVTQMLSTCSTFITYGSPDPIPGSPCCDAVSSLNNLGNLAEDRRSVCHCFMGLVATYNPSSTALATLPGFCGVSLGFVVEPNTDCSYVP